MKKYSDDPLFDFDIEEEYENHTKPYEVNVKAILDDLLECAINKSQAIDGLVYLMKYEYRKGYTRAIEE